MKGLFGWSNAVLSIGCAGAFLLCAAFTEKLEQFWILLVAVPIVVSVTIYMLRDLAKSGEPSINVIIQLFALVANFILLYAAIYRALGIIDTKDATSTDLIDCIYFSVITWTTTGYGDFRPSQSGRLIAASEALLGYVFMTIIVGMMARTFSRSGRSGSAS
jgi:voltage-gated potassium channel Kch